MSGKNDARYKALSHKSSANYGYKIGNYVADFVTFSAQGCLFLLFLEGRSKGPRQHATQSV